MDATPIIRRWIEGNFLRYQQRWILDDARFALAEKARQIGFTDGSAARCVVRGLLLRRPQIVLSAARDNAAELLEAARRHCRFLGAIGLRGADDWTVDNESEISWRSGGSITALASNQRTARSFHGDVYFDEFAYHQDADAVYAAAAPMATRGDWQVRVVSTPNGAVGKFYELATDTPASWVKHSVSLNDAERDGLRVDRAALLDLVGGDERVFGEAYLLQYLAGQLQYLPTELLREARDWQGQEPAFAQLDSIEVHAGLDVGRTRDVTALCIVVVHRGVAWVLDVITWPRTKFREQHRLIRQARDAFHWDTLHVDATGLGSQLAEELADEFGSEVTQVLFTDESKEDLATRTLKWLRTRRVRFPRGLTGVTLTNQGAQLQRVVSDKDAKVRYQFPRRSNEPGHCDEFTALMLALKGCGLPPVPRGMGQRPILAVA